MAPEKNEILGQVLAYGLPTNPLSTSSKYLKVVPAYFTYNGNRTTAGWPNPETTNQSGSGWGGAISFTYGFNPHWGVSLVGGYINQNGTVDHSAAVATAFSGGTTLNGWIPAVTGNYNSNAQTFSASIIFDPFKKPE